MDEKTVAEIAEEMIKDITDGIENTGLRAGIIGEVGISSLTANEKKPTVSLWASVSSGEHSKR